MGHDLTPAPSGLDLVRRDTVSSECGFTLVEMSVALLVLVIALALITPTFLAFNDSTTRTQAQSISDSAIRPALIEMTNLVGSASVLYTPCNSYTNTNSSVLACVSNGSTQTGFAEMVYDAANGGTCTQWQVLPAPTNSIDPGNSHEALLEVRTWPAGSNTAVAFSSFVSSVVLVNTSSQPVFSIPSGAVSGDLLNIDMFVSSGSKSPTVEIQTKVAAQGVSHSDSCGNPPPT
jgi:prepilin-type N-terminal cleavage/methylation domain-containing protein